MISRLWFWGRFCGGLSFVFLGISFWVGRNDMSVDQLAGFLCFVLVVFGVLNFISDFLDFRRGG